MTEDKKNSAAFIYDDLRLKTFPIAARFLKNRSDFSEKTRQPSKTLGIKVAICQAVTMVRNFPMHTKRSGRKWDFFKNLLLAKQCH